LTLYKIETAESIATKFGTVDLSTRGPPKPNLVHIHPLGTSGEMGEI